MKNLRFALHQIADILADAIEADEREERVQRRKGTPRRPPLPEGESTPEMQAAAREFLGRTGT